MASSTVHTVKTGGRLKYLLILDFEATCGDAVQEKEIIEFPTLLYDIQKDEVQDTFHEYVRPVLNPTLTPFCTNLTGIKQETVNAADTFPDTWERFQSFLRKHGVPDNPDSHVFVTCGNWDLQTMLPEQLAISDSEHGLDASGKLVSPYNNWINLKSAFRRHYKLKYGKGMSAMLDALKMTLEGRHHSGIDDCKNILRIIQRMRADGWRPQNESMP